MGAILRVSDGEFNYLTHLGRRTFRAFLTGWVLIGASLGALFSQQSFLLIPAGGLSLLALASIAIGVRCADEQVRAIRLIRTRR